VSERSRDFEIESEHHGRIAQPRQVHECARESSSEQVVAEDEACATAERVGHVHNHHASQLVFAFVPPGKQIEVMRRTRM
jgi:hypothetical protein